MYIPPRVVGRRIALYTPLGSREAYSPVYTLWYTLRYTLRIPMYTLWYTLRYTLCTYPGIHHLWYTLCTPWVYTTCGTPCVHPGIPP